jgi:DEAD/DEAH box helicase domain-containing protein
VTILEEFAQGPVQMPADDDDVADGVALEQTSASMMVVKIDEPVAPDARHDVAGIAAHGEVHVASRVVGFKKIKFYTNENIGSGELDLPEQQMHTTSYWLTIPAAVMAALPYDRNDKRDGVSGLAFAMRNVAQLLLMCDRQDIGLSVDAGNPELGSAPASTDASMQPRIFVYDNYPGGIGFSEPLFQLHGTLLRDTQGLIGSCPCDNGCPSCVGPAGEVGPRAKAVASALLHLLVSFGTDTRSSSAQA